MRTALKYRKLCTVVFLSLFNASTLSPPFGECKDSWDSKFLTSKHDFKSVVVFKQVVLYLDSVASV